ncbi:MAG: PAC2 family protein [Candidatus Hadarchaeales archaeon]
MPVIERMATPPMKQPVMIAGLPGIASVGKLAVDYMIYQLKAKKFLSYYSEHFPEWAVPEAGEIRMMKLEFHHARPQKAKKDFILVTADAQAATPRGQYMLVGELLDLAEEYGVKTVGTMAAYVLSPEEKRRVGVGGAATTPQLTEIMEKNGIGILQGGVVVGMNGLLPALASLRGMDGFCLLGVTEGGLLDPVASANVLKALGSMMGFTIDVSELLEQARFLPRGYPAPPPPREEETTYIG